MALALPWRHFLFDAFSSREPVSTRIKSGAGFRSKAPWRHDGPPPITKSNRVVLSIDPVFPAMHHLYRQIHPPGCEPSHTLFRPTGSHIQKLFAD
jgi:hypothetical protein